MKTLLKFLDGFGIGCIILSIFVFINVVIAKDFIDYGDLNSNVLLGAILWSCAGLLGLSLLSGLASLLLQIFTNGKNKGFE